MIAKPHIEFAKPDYSYDELEAQLKAYSPQPEKYPHDVPSIISIEEGLRAGRLGNVAVGGCLYKKQSSDYARHEQGHLALSPHRLPR